MARNSARPGRTVAAFFIGLAIAYGLVALIGTWKPALGLDLEGGTQITLVADGNVPKDQLNQAADIINARVNGSGVSEAEVTTQGSNEIVVQVPGSTKGSLVETVVRQARLRFRLVAQVPQTTHRSKCRPSRQSSAANALIGFGQCRRRGAPRFSGVRRVSIDRFTPQVLSEEARRRFRVPA